MRSPLPLLLTLLVLVMVAALLWLRASAEAPAPVPSPAPPAGGSASGGASPASAAMDGRPAAGTANGDHTGSRSPADAVAALDDLASLSVQVVAHGIGPNAGERPLPGVEVWLNLDGDLTTAISADDGRARFLPGRGVGHTATVGCALGASTTLRLTAGDNVAVLCIRPTILVQGRVVDPDGRGIAAELLLQVPDTPTARHPARRVGLSAPDGSFVLGCEAVAQLSARHRDFGPCQPVALRGASDSASPPQPQTVRLVLRATMASLDGEVVDPAGQPLPGVRLCFDCSDRDAVRGTLTRRGPAQWVRTDADGRFVVHHLVPGAASYVASLRGFGSQRGSLQLAADGNPPLRLRLGPAASVAGTVRDGDGAPLPGAELFAGAVEDPIAAARADDNGRYLLTDLPPGPISLRAFFGTGPGDERFADTRVDLVADIVAAWDPVLVAGGRQGTLAGHLLDDGERPLAHWKLWASPPRGMGWAGETNSDGAFTLPAAPLQPSFDLRVFSPGRPPTEFADAVFPGLSAAAAPFRLEVPPGRTSTVRGRVVDEHRRALPAQAMLRHALRGESVNRSAGTDGTLVFTAVPGGALELRLSHPEQATRWQSIAVVAGTDLDLGELVMERGARLHGAVQGPDGKPPADCQLTIFVGEQRLRGTYDNGQYAFTGLPTGKLLLQVQATDCASATFELAVGVGEDHERGITLAGGARRLVTIDVPHNGGELVTAWLRPLDPRRPQVPHWHAAASVLRPAANADGTATFAVCMATGDYELSASTAAGHRTKATIRFAPSDTSDVRLRLEPR